MADVKHKCDHPSLQHCVRKKFTEAPNWNQGVVVTVHVGHGSDTKTFSIHQDLLVQHSEFFQAALRNDWKEAKERTVSLVEDAAESFEMFSRFLYSGNIFSSKEGDEYTNIDGSSGDHEWARLSVCWELGEKLLSCSFKDAVVDAIIAKKVDTGRFPTGMHRFIYPTSTAKSVIRKLLVDIAIWDWSNDTLSSQRQDPRWADFFFDVAVAFKKAGGKGKAPYLEDNTCRYHEHGGGNPCYKKMNF